MIRKLFYSGMMAALLGMVEFSCSENISDCPTKMCVLANNWQLVDAYIDGKKDTEDLSRYKIYLIMPSATATQGNFTRKFLLSSSSDGDEGTWKTQNNDQELLLVPSDSPQESYIIDSYTPRQLVLVLNRNSNKTGPSQLKYIFEPFYSSL